MKAWSRRVFLMSVVAAAALAGTTYLFAQNQPLNAPIPEAVSKMTRLQGVRHLVAASPSSPPQFITPPGYSQCLQFAGIPCYSPQQIQNAYGVTSLLNAGYNGAGQTIIIIDSFGSPTIAADLHQFDLAFGVPDPPSFTVLAPLGSVPFDPNNATQVGWAFETTIDVEWAHATAPGASIVLLTSPIAETNGVQGMPEFLYLESYALDHQLGTIISQSWGVTENTLFSSQQGLQVFNDFENLYARAGRQGVTVLAAAGDYGTGGPNLTGGFYSFPVVTFPASSPLVTAVGGTSLYTDADGNYLNETVWNSSGTYLLTGLLADAGGGGVSQQFSEPDYQYGLPESVQQILNQHRGIPDVAYDSDVLTSSFVWIGFFPNVLYNGWYSASGTSEASPQWAGIVAIANQFAGHPLGFLNPKLYALGYANGSEVFHDITFGSNAFPYAAVPGYLATPGWDLASGWGTPKVDALVRSLAGMKDEGCGNACEQRIKESENGPPPQRSNQYVPLPAFAAPGLRRAPQERTVTATEQIERATPTASPESRHSRVEDQPLLADNPFAIFGPPNLCQVRLGANGAVLTGECVYTSYPPQDCRLRVSSNCPAGAKPIHVLRYGFCEPPGLLVDGGRSC